ncbi:hypothetical protein RHGRI_020704 [Rhododendron griersonianum]|uniref:SWIM-type domain-containing protein n=1 Tax=Rhododendron griersonianum TaxID=479676 RepID=A0AAV6JPS4_9ERIC|nr:hypothetical protein RHGRI_020704 [Rhododendron griersonianum]
MRFSCERSGKYRPFVKKVDGNEVAVKKRVRSTGTKKCECPFELKAVKGNNGWTVSVHNGTHNHPPAVYLEGHSYAGRLSAEQTSMVVDLSIALVKPREILTHLKVQDPENVMSIKTVYNYEERLCVLKRNFEMVPAALEYVEKNWAESLHSQLKNHLENSQCNFDILWEKIHRLMLLQVTEVKASFEKSLNSVQHGFRTTLFDRLRGVVSSNAMTLVLAASHQVEWFVESKRQCECSLRHTHGLPCAHEIAPYKMANIPLPIDLIHDHWKRLSLLAPRMRVRWRRRFWLTLIVFTISF